MSIKSFPYCKHLLQENYVEYNHFLPLLKLVSKILCHVVTFGFWIKHFQTGGLGEMVRHPGHHDRRISPPPLTSFKGGMLRTKCFRHQFQILQIWKARITDAFATVTEDMLENTWRETDYRLDVLRATKWAHVEVYWCVVKKLLELHLKKKVCIPCTVVFL